MKTWWNILICMWIYFIHGAVNVNGRFELTSSPLTATNGELFTLTCSFSNESTVNIGWLQNNNTMFVSQMAKSCQLASGYNNMLHVVSCNTTAHSLTFTFNSTTDKGSTWQCGNLVSDSDIHPRSNSYTIDVASSDLSTQSLSTTTLSMAISSDPETVPLTKGPVMSTLSLSTTRYMETTSDPGTVTTKNAFTGEKDPNLLYIVVGAVGGAVLLTVVVVGVVCIRWRRRAAHQQNDMKEERINKATTVNQNTSDYNTVGNDLYEGSRDVQPMNAAMNQQDDFMLSDAYASVDMPVTNTCTPREEVPSGDVNLENLSPVYQNTTGNITVENDLYEGSRDVQPMNAAMNQEDDLMLSVSDIYAEVQKPKKNKQDDPMVSEI